MPCAFCSGGDRWIKTCRTKDGFRLCVRNPCYEVLRSWLVIVPGDGVVVARCDGCGAYFNPREMAEFRPGGRYNTYSGTYWACTKIDAARHNWKSLTRLLRTSNLPPVPPVNIHSTGGKRSTINSPSPSVKALAKPKRSSRLSEVVKNDERREVFQGFDSSVR
jgi:hypothetical protein